MNIYGLADPDTGHLRYVGKTRNSLGTRLAEHKYRSSRSRTHSAQWMHSLALKGKIPDIFLIESVPTSKWEEAETFWISYFRMIGAALCNHSAGGNGRSDYVPSPEARAKQGAALRGRKYSAEHRRRIAEAKRGVKRPDLSARNKLRSAKFAQEACHG